MKKHLKLSFSALAVGALCSLYSCSKQEINPTAPTAVAGAQDGKIGVALDQAKAAWDNFVSSVDRGQTKDPYGQYVSKDTWVDNNGERPMRPKQDVSSRKMNLVSVMGKNGEVYDMLKPMPAPIDLPCEPDVVICPPTNPDPYYPPTPPPPPTFTFQSSEGKSPYNGSDNPQGYIYDLKIRTVRNLLYACNSLTMRRLK